MSTLTLQEAKRCYGYLVPWELDKKDLGIINRLRNSFGKNEIFFAKSADISDLICKKLWEKAQRASN